MLISLYSTTHTFNKQIYSSKEIIKMHITATGVLSADTTFESDVSISY